MANTIWLRFTDNTISDNVVIDHSLRHFSGAAQQNQG